MASSVAALRLVALVILGVVLLAKPVSEHVRQAAQARVLAPVKAKPSRATGRGAEAGPGGDVRDRPQRQRPRRSSRVERREGAQLRLYDRHGRERAAQRFTRTLVMYRKGYQAEGARLAKDLRVKIVGPLDLRPADMLGAHVALVVGAGRSSSAVPGVHPGERPD